MMTRSPKIHFKLKVQHSFSRAMVHKHKQANRSSTEYCTQTCLQYVYPVTVCIPIFGGRCTLLLGIPGRWEYSATLGGSHTRLVVCIPDWWWHAHPDGCMHTWLLVARPAGGVCGKNIQFVVRVRWLRQFGIRIVLIFVFRCYFLLLPPDAFHRTNRNKDTI